MPARPIRVKINDELGIPTTLPEGGQYLQVWGNGPDTLILCPGPNPKLCAALLDNQERIFWLTLPDFAQQMPPAWHQSIPSNWQPISIDQIAGLPRQIRKILYTPAKRLFPAQLAPILARQQICPTASTKHTKEIWLPTPSNGLIVQEMARAAGEQGFTPRILPADLRPENLIQMLNHRVPAFFISINFHGLDSFGENQTLLEAAGVPIAVWCVDNPFHLLTAQKNRLWQRLFLFVTDSWFIEPLRHLGARPIHLPLGTDPALFRSGNAGPDGYELFFVGRSYFPDRDRFFAAATIPKSVQTKAMSLPGRQAHFGWWQKELGKKLWPGNQVRDIGLGAEIKSQKWRAQCLNYLADKSHLTIVGDAAWADLVPQATLRPPVDYYHGLVQTYQQASFVLNLTSLLLPHGLTQRHFDVWACGGFLLSDQTLGLEIFPVELTQGIMFTSPEQALELIHYFAKHPQQKKELQLAWQELILKEHTYFKRLETLLKYCTKELDQAS